MPFLRGRRRVRRPGLPGERPPYCRPGALTGRYERASASMKVAPISLFTGVNEGNEAAAGADLNRETRQIREKRPYNS